MLARLFFHISKHSETARSSSCHFLKKKTDDTVIGFLFGEAQSILISSGICLYIVCLNKFDDGGVIGKTVGMMFTSLFAVYGKRNTG